MSGDEPKQMTSRAGRRGVALISALLLLSSCSTASYNQAAGYVIVPGDMLGIENKGELWTPTDDAVARCQLALGRTLRRSGYRLGHYVLRFGGTIRDGHPLIIGFGANKTDAAHMLRPWDGVTVVLPAWGGGDTFFRFAYDVSSDTVTQFAFNAPL